MKELYIALFVNYSKGKKTSFKMAILADNIETAEVMAKDYMKGTKKKTKLEMIGMCAQNKNNPGVFLIYDNIWKSMCAIES